MRIIPSIAIGIVIYLAIHFGEKGVHFIYFYVTHDFATSNTLMIKSSVMLAFATLLGGGIAGYLSRRGLLSGFIVGILSGISILVVQQLTGANPLWQEFTPAILFDEVFLKACVCSAAGAAGELINRKRETTI